MLVCIYVAGLLVDMPITGDLSSWKGTPTLMAYAATIVLALYGFRSATAGRPLLGDRIRLDPAG